MQKNSEAPKTSMRLNDDTQIYWKKNYTNSIKITRSNSISDHLYFTLKNTHKSTQI